jgi:hypothetical protein
MSNATKNYNFMTHGLGSNSSPRDKNSFSDEHHEQMKQTNDNFSTFIIFVLAIFTFPIWGSILGYGFRAFLFGIMMVWDWLFKLKDKISGRNCSDDC